MGKLEIITRSPLPIVISLPSRETAKKFRDDILEEMSAGKSHIHLWDDDKQITIISSEIQCIIVNRF